MHARAASRRSRGSRGARASHAFTPPYSPEVWKIIDAEEAAAHAAFVAVEDAAGRVADVIRAAADATAAAPSGDHLWIVLPGTCDLLHDDGPSTGPDLDRRGLANLLRVPLANVVAMTTVRP